ncbi:MAG: S-layer homology domain-containing protein, partial [Thermus sp.]|nr:S-layer homology domain-containing protein [Thermus sp.]
MAHLPRYLLAAGVGFLVAQAQTADIPKGHWAEKAVRELLDRGILTGYPDGTFKGNQGVSRYQAAVMLYRAYLTWLDEVLSRVRRTLEEGGLAPERVAEALSELEALKASTAEVQGALEEYGVRLSTLEADLEEVRGALGAALDASGQVATLTDRQKALEAALARADGAFKEQLTRLAQLEARLQGVEKALEELATGLKEAEAARLKDAQAVGRRIYSLEERTAALEDRVQTRAQG